MDPRIKRCFSQVVFPDKIGDISYYEKISVYPYGNIILRKIPMRTYLDRSLLFDETEIPEFCWNRSYLPYSRLYGFRICKADVIYILAYEHRTGKPVIAACYAGIACDFLF